MNLYQHSFFAMDAQCQLQFYCHNKVSAKQAFKKCEAEIRRLELKYSRYGKGSIVHRINSNPGKYVTLDFESSTIFSYADTAHNISNGLFDVTLGAFHDLWNIRSGRCTQANNPDKNTIEATLGRVGWSRIFWGNNTIMIPKGMNIDLGGILTEYTVDAIRAMAENLGIHYGLINLGGDVSVIGPHPDLTPWTIGIKHPDKHFAETCLTLSRGSIASSRDYRSYFIKDSKRYSSTVNPLTGECSSGVASVTIMAPHCVVAGAIATTAMLRGEQAGKKYMRDLGLSHVIYHRNENDEAVLVSSTESLAA